MDADNLDEKMIRWNDIFDQMVIDVQTLIKDFSGMINWPIPLAVLVFLLGGASFAAAILVNGTTIIIVYSFIIMCSCITSGILILRHWYAMKLRYERLFSLQREMESS
ncbi:MAG: hypothetical protein ACXADF_16830 [Candidatus Thorarchaeota archaeon]|jgi:hypothetical protein